MGGEALATGTAGAERVAVTIDELTSLVSRLERLVAALHALYRCRFHTEVVQAEIALQRALRGD